MTAETMTRAPGFWRTVYDATLGDLVSLTLAQPHQVCLSAGSVALMAQFAAHGAIVNPLVGYLIAVGVEWAYLRGLASNAKAPTMWATLLNWSAFGIVVLWGVLWCASVYGAFSVEAAKASGGAWWLALAHVVPVAWLSLCAAMTHGAAVKAEVAERQRRQAEAEEQARQADKDRQAFERAQEEEDRKLARWKEAQRLKAELRVDAAPRMRAGDDAANARQERMDADKQECPSCGTHIPERPKYLAAKRWGRCAACKAA